MSASLGRQITIKPRTGRSPKAPANPKEKQLKKKTMRSDKLPPMHPGKILCEEFMEPQAITQYRPQTSNKTLFFSRNLCLLTVGEKTARDWK